MRKAGITKEQIVNAAASIFNEKGLENTTVDDIAKKAGIAKGSIYLYFKTRDEIFLEGIKYAANTRIEKLKELLSLYKSAKDKLQALLKANAKMAETHPEIFFMNYALIISTHRNIKSQGASEYFKKYLELVEEIIKEGIKNKEFRALDPRIMALTIILTQDLSHIITNIDEKLVKTDGIINELMQLITNS